MELFAKKILMLRMGLTQQIKGYIIRIKYNCYIKSNTFYMNERSY